MNRFSISTLLVLACIAGTLSSGCRGMTLVVHRDPKVDIGSIERIAIVPFRNFSSDRLAGEKVTAIFTSVLSKITSLEIVDSGELLQSMAELRVNKDMISDAIKKRLGKKLKAQALIFGTVEEYGMVKLSDVSLPVVSVSVRMVDTETGKVVWVATATDSGLSRVPIINIGETRTRSALAAKIAIAIIQSVYLQ